MPSPAAPRVSVIIPVYGKLSHTLACLRSIAQHGAAATFEVIVIDDASPDDSTQTLASIPGLRLMINPHNLGFIGRSEEHTSELQSLMRTSYAVFSLKQT